MNPLTWLAVLLLSFSWLFAIPVFAATSTLAWMATAGSGAAIFLWQFTRHDRSTSSGLRALLVLAAAMSAQGILVLAWFRIGPHVHHVPGLSSLLALPLRILGYPIHVEGAVIHMTSAEHLVPVSVTWEKLGLLPISLFVAMASLTLLAHQRERLGRALGILFAGSAAYVAMRFIALMLFVVQHDDPMSLGAPGTVIPHPVHWFSNPAVQLASFVPLALLLSLAVRWQKGAFIPAPNNLRMALGGLCVFLGATGVTWLSTTRDMGEANQGRVLIDSSKTPNWERTDRAFDTEWYGRESVYNFVTAKDYLAKHFDVEVNEDQALESELLTDFDVLLVKTPTRPFAPTELDAIVDWVEHGGGLYLLGDHTDLLGMTTHMNTLSERFGIQFNRDGCNQLDDGGFVHHWAPRPFRHPLLARVDDFSYLTSCTLSVPWDAEPVFVGTNTFSDPADYSKSSFFGNMIPNTDDTFGMHVLGALVHHGEGRVLAFSDSTLFSTFCVMPEDRPNFVVDSVAYLNRTSKPQSTSWLLLSITGLAVILGGAWVARPSRPYFAMALPTALGLGILLGCDVSYGQAVAAFPATEPHSEMQTLALVRDNGNYSMPAALARSRTGDLHAYDTLFTWTQRIGWFPRERSFEDSLQDDVVMFIHPNETLDAGQAEALHDYVFSGGRLLVIDTILNPETAADSILRPFGLSIDTTLSSNDETRALRLPSNIVLGGEPCMTDPSGNALAASIQYGAGCVLAVSEGAGLSRLGLGSQMDQPNEATLSRFDETFTLLRTLLPEPAVQK